MVTSSPVTKMSVTPFDPQYPKTPAITQTSQLYLLQNRSYCWLKFYNVGIVAKNNGKYKTFYSYRKSDADDTKTHILAHYRLF